MFANSLGDRTAEAPIQFRVETGMTLSLSITFNGNPQGPGTASFFVNTDCVGQVEVRAPRILRAPAAFSCVWLIVGGCLLC